MREKIRALQINQFFSASLVMVFGTNLINLFNYIYHFVMGRMLGPSNYGELAALISLAGLLLIIPSSVGLSVARLVATEKHDEKLKQILNWVLRTTLIFSIIFSLIFFLLSSTISGYLKIFNNWSVVLSGVFFTFSMLSFIYKSTLQGLLKFGQLVLAMIGETIVKLILGIIFVVWGYGTFGALGAILLGAILGLLVAKGFVGNFFKAEGKISPKKDKIKEIFLYSIPLTIYTIAQTSLFSADLILVKHFLPSFEAGLYAALSSLGKIIFFGAGPIVFVMFPMISQKFSKKENYMKIFYLSLLFTLLVCTFVLLLFYFIPDIVIKFSVGSLYINASGLLFLFGIFMTFISFSNLLTNYLLALKKTKVVILPSLAAIMQIALINFFHASLEEVIYISLVVSFSLLLSLTILSLRKNEN